MKKTNLPWADRAIREARDEGAEAMLAKFHAILGSRWKKLTGPQDNQDIGYRKALEEIGRLLEGVRGELAMDWCECPVEGLEPTTSKIGEHVFENRYRVRCGTCGREHGRFDKGLEILKDPKHWMIPEAVAA